jgi:hypothetical protein
MKNYLMILLGCNNRIILNDRINTAINHVLNLNDTNINWFLSGGIKYHGNEAESIKMKKKLEKINKDWSFIIDDNSTNTAENLINMSLFLNTTNNIFDDIYIVTSKFHFRRVNYMLSLIHNLSVNWLLGNEYGENDYYMEQIHIQNVLNDVIIAKKKLMIF